MIHNEDKATINNGMMILNIIWAAMLTSLGIYLFIGAYAANTIQTSMDEKAIQVLRNVLYAISAITLIATKYISNRILLSKFSVKHQDTSIQNPAVGRYLIAMIISLFLSESIGIYGLILFFLGKSTTDLFILILLAAMAMIYYRPKRDAVEKLSKQFRKPQHTI